MHSFLFENNSDFYSEEGHQNMNFDIDNAKNEATLYVYKFVYVYIYMIKIYIRKTYIFMYSFIKL